jgi:hypothetical protein
MACAATCASPQSWCAPSGTETSQLKETSARVCFAAEKATGVGCEVPLLSDIMFTPNQNYYAVLLSK